MKNLILSLLLAPVLLFSQGPSFSVTDSNGVLWDSETWLDLGVTIVVQFFAPSETCWPSYQALQNLSLTNDLLGNCNDILFLQVATWGNEYTSVNYVEEFGTLECPVIDGDQGYEMAMSWYGEENFGLTAVYELWILHPDGSYSGDINFASDLYQTVLIDALEYQGFNECENNTGIEDDNNGNQSDHLSNYCCSHCDAMSEYTLPKKCLNGPIYDLKGKQIKEKPKSGFYIQNGMKYVVIK